jgi:hypothetical protein
MKDPLQAMAHIVNGAGEHGTGNLEEDEARSRIDVGSCRPFKRNKERCDLHSAKQKKQGA